MSAWTIPDWLQRDIDLRMLREKVGEGTAYFIKANDPPSQNVWLCGLEVAVAAADPVLPRLDLACINTADDGRMQLLILRGTPSTSAVSRVCPGGWIPVAVIRRLPGAVVVTADDLREVR